MSGQTVISLFMLGVTVFSLYAAHDVKGIRDKLLVFAMWMVGVPLFLALVALVCLLWFLAVVYGAQGITWLPRWILENDFPWAWASFWFAFAVTIFEIGVLIWMLTKIGPSVSWTRDRIYEWGLWQDELANRRDE